MNIPAKWFLFAVLSALLLGAVPPRSSAQTPTPCTPVPGTPGCTCTGFLDPETNTYLNAQIINPTSPVTGTVVATNTDTTGGIACNIGVYFNTTGKKLQVGDKNLPTDISGATHYGVLVDGSVGDIAVDVTNTHVHNIRDNTKPNSQQGVGISYRAFQVTGTAGGTVSSNTVDDYQKGGIEASGQGANVTIRNNTVTGSPLPPAQNTFLAQNGIQVGFGATCNVTGNTVSHNSVHNPDDSGFAATGVLVPGGPFYNGTPPCNNTSPCPYTTGTQVMRNTLTDNDVGAYLFNPMDSNLDAPTTMTNDKVINNTMSVSSCSNAYVVGASVIGNNDKVINNNMTGYTGSRDPNTGLGCFPVDPSPTPGNHGTSTKVHASPHK